ncbi:MAG: tRNA pseudouridine(38-40) synthase TruA [Chloroflexi bacterium]|nr:tRNA pseudouridine(38-40) synthase TruA [Chloroflexota bacterium]
MNASPKGRRLALLIEYEGTSYGGSQYQKNIPTIQGQLELAIGKLTNESIRVSLAGRTDAGVHARGQVASFVTASRHRVQTVVRALNAHLPNDIGVRAATEVPDAFDPRRSAASRLYRYSLHLGAQRPVIDRRFLWHIGPQVDLEAMEAAVRLLCGRHDFAAFTPPSVARVVNTEREVSLALLTRDGEVVRLDVRANAFLQHMVRRIVGGLVQVGTGKHSRREFEILLRDAEPGAARSTAPARGLSLIKVRYDSGLFDDETNDDIQP